MKLKSVELADTEFKRFAGLMLRKKVKKPLVFPLPAAGRMRASIHMMFMRFPIDVLWLDEKKKVVDKKTLHPWCVNATPRKAAKYVIEMKKGAAGKVRIGDRVTW